MRDSLIGAAAGARAGDAMEVIPDYLIVLDTAGRAVYVSRRRGAPAVGPDLTLQESALDIEPGTTATLLTLRSDQIFLSARLENDQRSRSRASSPAVHQHHRGALARPAALDADAGALLAGDRRHGGVRHRRRAIRPITPSSASSRRSPTVARCTGVWPGRTRRATSWRGLTSTLNAMIGRLESSFGGAAPLHRRRLATSSRHRSPCMRADVERAMQAQTQPTEQLVALEEALQQTTRMADLVTRCSRSRAPTRGASTCIASRPARPAAAATRRWRRRSSSARSRGIEVTHADGGAR